MSYGMAATRETADHAVLGRFGCSAGARTTIEDSTTWRLPDCSGSIVTSVRVCPGTIGWSRRTDARSGRRADERTDCVRRVIRYTAGGRTAGRDGIRWQDTAAVGAFGTFVWSRWRRWTDVCE